MYKTATSIFRPGNLLIDTHRPSDSIRARDIKQDWLQRDAYDFLIGEMGGRLAVQTGYCLRSQLETSMQIYRAQQTFSIL
jgi:hypothetical protein